MIYTKKLKIYIVNTYYFLWLMLNIPNLLLKKVKFGKHLELRGFLFIKNKGLLTIGKNVRINSSGASNPIGGGVRSYFQILSGGHLIIEDEVKMSNVAITAAKSVIIKKNAYIGAGVGIFDTDFHSINPYERINKRRCHEEIETKEVIVGENAFIGTRSIILKGVTVGKNSVVGAGSVVTKNIPDQQIWAGNPAKFISFVNVNTCANNEDCLDNP